MKIKPGLFGLDKSNRDFAIADSWGKNQFNSSFPAALVCYMASKKLNSNYIRVKNKTVVVEEITPEDLMNISPLDPNVFYSFETQYTPFNKYVVGSLPRIDLVIQNDDGKCLRGLEVKLTALPDNTTCCLTEDKYGSEIVIRPDSIVYLAASIAASDVDIIQTVFSNSKIKIKDWTDASEVIQHRKVIIEKISMLSGLIENKQQPFLLQPIWKTIGKSPKLADNCLDVFVWSDAAFAFYITRVAKLESSSSNITRQMRTAIWLYKMLLDISESGKFNHKNIIDQLSYNTKNDKAFASSGNVTNPYMLCQNLVKPRILKSEIKDIILGGGQSLLSPERRFDAIIYSSPELFS